MFHVFSFWGHLGFFFRCRFGSRGLHFHECLLFFCICAPFLFFPVSFLGVVFDLGGLILTHVSCLFGIRAPCFGVVLGLGCLIFTILHVFGPSDLDQAKATAKTRA